MSAEDLEVWRDSILADLRLLSPPRNNSGIPWSRRRKADIVDAIRRGFAAMALLDEVLPAIDLAMEGSTAWAARVKLEIVRITGPGPMLPQQPPPLPE